MCQPRYVTFVLASLTLYMSNRNALGRYYLFCYFLMMFSELQQIKELLLQLLLFRVVAMFCRTCVEYVSVDIPSSACLWYKLYSTSWYFLSARSRTINREECDVIVLQYWEPQSKFEFEVDVCSFRQWENEIQKSALHDSKNLSNRK